MAECRIGEGEHKAKTGALRRLRVPFANCKAQNRKNRHRISIASQVVSGDQNSNCSKDGLAFSKSLLSDGRRVSGFAKTVKLPSVHATRIYPELDKRTDGDPLWGDHVTLSMNIHSIGTCICMPSSSSSLLKQTQFPLRQLLSFSAMTWLSKLQARQR